mmetsp:Transcript_8826/g.20851  ORF Transcript_8826/g.20851 Transcript_8826/m.20851 type:complete len:83 (+) Transcript_8826:49-297(+)|eukprot:278698-Rhodomonas_salina.3
MSLRTAYIRNSLTDSGEINLGAGLRLPAELAGGLPWTDCRGCDDAGTREGEDPPTTLQPSKSSASRRPARGGRITRRGGAIE